MKDGGDGKLAQTRPQRPIERRLQYHERRRALKLLTDSMRRAKALRKAVKFKKTNADGTFEFLEDFKISIIPSCVRINDGNNFLPAAAWVPNYRVPVLQLRTFDHFDLCVEDPDHPHYVQHIDEWCQSIRRRCQNAFAEGTAERPVRFVVFGELSFPSFWPGHPKKACKLDVRPQISRLRADLDRCLQNLATQHNAVIISGSCHDPATFENVASIYFPSSLDTTSHVKLTSAQAVGEYVRIARDITYPVYKIGWLKFCVLICSDAFDLNIFFQQIWLGSGSSDIKPQIYFVPSYYLRPGPMHQMARACQQLSLATGTMVVFVNHGYDPDGATVFIAGHEIPLLERQGQETASFDVDWIDVFGRIYESERMRTNLANILDQGQ
jgi:hypothetical protein